MFFPMYVKQMSIIQEIIVFGFAFEAPNLVVDILLGYFHRDIEPTIPSFYCVVCNVSHLITIPHFDGYNFILEPCGYEIVIKSGNCVFAWIIVHNITTEASTKVPNIF